MNEESKEFACELCDALAGRKKYHHRCFCYKGAAEGISRPFSIQDCKHLKDCSTSQSRLLCSKTRIQTLTDVYEAILKDIFYLLKLLENASDTKSTDPR